MSKVLILENDPSNLHVFSFVLSSAGYDVLEAADEEEAISRCREHSVLDVFICDLGLGSSSGTDIALQVRSIHPEILVLFVSGTPKYAWDHRDVNRFLQLSVDSVDCLEKPFPPAVLLASVKRLLEKRAGRKPGKTAGGGV